MTNIVVSLSREVWRMLTGPLSTDVGLLAASQYTGATIGFLTNIFAARILGPIEYGSAALILTYPTLLWSFLSFKPVTVTIRYISSMRASQQRAELASICKVGYTLDLLASAVISLLILATSWWVAEHIYKLPDVSWLIIIYGASLPLFSLIGTSQAILSSWQCFRWLSLFQIIEKLIALILVMVFLSFGFGVSGMIIAIAIGHSINGILMLIVATRLLYLDGYGFWWKGSLSNITSLRKELTSFFGWNYLFVTLGGVVGQVPIMLLGRIRGPEEAGFYRLAMSIATVASYVESSLGRVAYPDLSARWAKGERENIKLSLKRWTLQGGLPVGILLIFIIPLLPIFIPVVFGPAYNSIVTGVQIMMVGAAGSAVFFWLNSFYYASGQIVLWTKAYGLYTVLIIGLGWIFIQQWGFVGFTVLITLGKILFVLLMGGSIIASGKLRNENLHLPSSR